MTSIPSRPRWFVAGDLNGFFGLVVDNLSILGFIAAALIGIFGFPPDIVFTRMFPGTALGVLVGNLIYTVMARRLAMRTGRHDVTAMPLGLDAPTSIGMALLVLGPAFVAWQAQGLDAESAAIATWQLGMASLVVMGLLKLVLSFFGEAVTRLVPRAGLLGSIAGIALVLMGFLPLVEAMRSPIVGFVTLGLLLYVLLAKGQLPVKLPGVFVAFVAGTLLYYGLGAAGLGVGFSWPQSTPLQLVIPWPSLGFIEGLPATVDYLPLLLPFGLLMVVGGINVSESARAAGDDYRTRDILLAEAVSTLVAGVCGGVAQTTPYIGQPAYKHMGARSGYTLLAGLFIGFGGMLGVVSGLVQWLPLAVLAPIIVYVALDITTQAFQATPPRHAAAMVLGFLPSVAYMLAIKVGNPAWIAPERFAELMTTGDGGLPEMAVIVTLGNGFIITAMIWTSSVVAMIDGQLRRAAAFLLVGAALASVGLIHSVDPRGAIYLPWTLEGLPRLIAMQFVGAYLALAAVMGLLSLQRIPSADTQPV